MGQYGDLIGIVIAVVLMVGSGAANWIKQQREKTEAERRQRERMEQIQLRTQLPRGEEAAPNLDSVAAQRREQLRQLALQRQQQGAPPTAVQGAAAGDPTNLSMAERIARARAKEQYNRRAEQMRQGGGPSRQPDAPPRPQPARQPQAQPQRPQGASEAQRAAEQARQEARARAQREAERARAERARAMREQARRAEQLAQRKAEQVARDKAARKKAAPRGRAASNTRDAPAAIVHHVGVLSPRAARGGVGIAVDAQSIRHAIVLKEVLDRPIALRQPGADHAF